MHSAKTHPTPQYVIDAIHVIASWLREIEAVEVLISPQGGAAWHGERQADRLLARWQEAEARADANFRIYQLTEKYHNEDMLLMQEMEKVIAAATHTVDEADIESYTRLSEALDAYEQAKSERDRTY